MLIRKRRRRNCWPIRQRNRRGAAVVEAAIALPLILAIVMGTVEVCNGIFLKQALKLMAYEGARVAVIPDSTLTDVTQQVEELAAERGIAVQEVAVVPESFASSPQGTIIEVQVTSAASQPNRTSLFSNAEKTVSVFIMKDLD